MPPFDYLFGGYNRPFDDNPQSVTGRMTWFNPKPWNYTDPDTNIDWTDEQAKARREGAHASGLPLETPGFATAGQGGLGGWHEVTLPDGRKYVTQKTDVGPSGVVDLNAALASQAYPGGPRSVPGGQATARYLGRTLPSGMAPGEVTDRASGSPAGLPELQYALPGGTDAPPGSDYPQGAVARGGRRMPENNSLLSMFQPQGGYYGPGGTRPQDFASALAASQGAFIQGGLGLMAGGLPGLMRGYGAGSASDISAGQHMQSLAERRAERAQAQQNFERTFARGEQPTYAVHPPDPILGGGYITEQRPGQMPRILPYPTPGETATAGTPAVPAASAAPAAVPFGSGGPVPFVGQSGAPAATIPRPQPAAPAAVAPAAGEEGARNEEVLRSLPTQGFRDLVKDLADYKIDPATVDPKYRTQALIAASRYRPDYSMAEYAKRGTPLSPEAAARVGLAKGFINRLGDRTDERGNTIPGIRSRIAGGELQGFGNEALAAIGQGGPGEIRRAIDEGAEGLLRTLTGAGMNESEARNYQRRYQWDARDTQATRLQKLGELESALRYTATEMGRGRGGEDMLKGFTSQFGRASAETAAGGVPPPPAPAIRALRQNSSAAMRDQFDEKYGSGAAMRALTGK